MESENFIACGEILPLWSDSVPGYDASYGQPEPTLSFFSANQNGINPGGAVVVCPGGGYSRKAAHEGVPVASWFNANGISVFVLDYRVAPYRHPYPLLDGQRAIRYVRCNAERLRVDPLKIAIMGFSAGGHVASSVATHFDNGIPDAADPIERFSCRPDAQVLAYPVISFVSSFHQGSMGNLLGSPDAPRELRELMSCELQVSAATPPAFLWHTAADASVPVANSLMYADALGRCNVPFALHVFETGWHGMGLAPENPEINQWKCLCVDWLRQRGF